MVSDLRVKWCDSEKPQTHSVTSTTQLARYCISSGTYRAFPTPTSLQHRRHEKRRHIFTRPTVVISKDEPPNDIECFDLSDNTVQSDFGHLLSGRPPIPGSSSPSLPSLYSSENSQNSIQKKAHGSFVAIYPLKSSSGYSNSSPTTRTTMVHE